MTVRISATYPASDGRSPENIEIEWSDETVAPSVDDLCDVVASLAGVTTIARDGGPVLREQGRPVTTIPMLRIVDHPNRTVAIEIGDREVIRTDYDAVGWSGLHAFATVAEEVALAYSLPHERVDADDEDPDESDPIDYPKAAAPATPATLIEVDAGTCDHRAEFKNADGCTLCRSAL